MPRKNAKPNAPARRTKSGAKVTRRSNAQQAQLRQDRTEQSIATPKGAESKVKGRTWSESRPRAPKILTPEQKAEREEAKALALAEAEALEIAVRVEPGRRLPAVAIVGRPNVGKSALFNRLAGRRISIVHEQPGVTRDRITAICTLAGTPFELVDTGGIGADADADFADMVEIQVDIAMSAAELILFTVDGRDGVTPVDAAVARTLRKGGRRVLLIVNKIDEVQHEGLALDFASLGFGDETQINVSAAHGRGITELVDRIAKELALEEAVPMAQELANRRARLKGRKFLALPTSATMDLPAPKAKFADAEDAIAENELGEAADDEAEPAPRDPSLDPPLLLAIVGRPNVGKSSLINAILEDNRTLVSDVAGTTRDAVDISYERDGRRFVLIDTAGLRQRTKMKDSVEVFSALRSERSIRRADLCVLVLDCSTGPTEQDKKIASLIKEAEKPCLIICNKFDLLLAGHEGQGAELRRNILRVVSEELHFVDYAQPVTLSALEGTRIPDVFESLEEIISDSRQRLTTGILNRIIEEAMQRNPPPPAKQNRRLKVLYGTHPVPRSSVPRALYPPEFVLFVNDDELLLPTYKRFLENEIRRHTPYRGLPILLRLRSRGKRK